MDVDGVYNEWKERFVSVCKNVIGTKVRYVRKGIRHMPAFLKKVYEIRNTLRKEAEVSENKKLFVQADEVSDKIKELSIKTNRRRSESFCSEIQ